jgi:nucleotide-binding universal stress UspA family protein
MITLKNVLVATDFSEESTTAVMYAREMARTFKATLHLLHVTASAVDGFTTDWARPQRDVEESALKKLDQLAAEDHQIPPKLIVLSSNSPAQAIVSYAKEAQIDLIIVGTHGRGGMRISSWAVSPNGWSGRPLVRSLQSDNQSTCRCKRRITTSLRLFDESYSWMSLVSVELAGDIRRRRIIAAFVLTMTFVSLHPFNPAAVLAPRRHRPPTGHPESRPPIRRGRFVLGPVSALFCPERA